MIAIVALGVVDAMLAAVAAVARVQGAVDAVAAVNGFAGAAAFDTDAVRAARVVIFAEDRQVGERLVNDGLALIAKVLGARVAIIVGARVRDHAGARPSDLAADHAAAGLAIRALVDGALPRAIARRLLAFT